MGEAFRQGVRGYAQDILLQAEPWAFDTNAIAAPVWILHGEADTLVPVAHARHTAEMIPRAHQHHRRDPEPHDRSRLRAALTRATNSISP
jgi:pimeloyl-ACP methyl ester carboxylesterase